jgi:CRISPR/Cas system Type II protein with McrA/HNH and RuvC-like nuclease domain
MSYSNYRYDENDRELEEISERLPENFDDFMKRHKQETIQLFIHCL